MQHDRCLGGGAQPTRPIPVELRQPDPGTIQVLVALIEPLIHPLTTKGIVVIFVIFILLRRRSATEPVIPDATCVKYRLRTRNRRRVVAHWRTERSTLGYAAMIMRFVPYIGAFISAIFPLVLAAAVGPGWTMVLMTAALFLVAKTVVGQAIEPLIYGQHRSLAGSCDHRRYFLDMAVGTNRSYSRNSTHNVLSGPGPPCRSTQVS